MRSSESIFSNNKMRTANTKHTSVLEVKAKISKKPLVAMGIGNNVLVCGHDVWTTDTLC